MRRLLALLLLGLLLAACGGSGGTRLSKQEFAKQADALCTKYTADLNKLGQPRSFAALAAFADKAVPLAQRLIDDTKKLKPPTDEQATVDSWAGENQKVVDAIKALGDAARKNDQKAAKSALDQGNAANKRSNVLGKQLGMNACTKS